MTRTYSPEYDDGLSRGRGERHPRATVSDADLRLALELYDHYGVPVREIAAKFEVTPRTVQYWLKGQRRFSG